MNSVTKIQSQFYTSANHQQQQRNNKEELQTKYGWFPSFNELITKVYFPAHYQGSSFLVDVANQIFFFFIALLLYYDIRIELKEKRKKLSPTMVSACINFRYHNEEEDDE